MAREPAGHWQASLVTPVCPGTPSHGLVAIDSLKRLLAREIWTLMRPFREAAAIAVSST